MWHKMYVMSLITIVSISTIIVIIIITATIHVDGTEELSVKDLL